MRDRIRQLFVRIRPDRQRKWLVGCCVFHTEMLAGLSWFHESRKGGPMTTRTLALLAALLASAPLRAERPPIHAGVPQVSRDGKRVLFVSNRDGRPEIYLMEIDGSEVRRLTKSGGYGPAWGPGPDEFVYATEHQGMRDWGHVAVA